MIRSMLKGVVRAGVRKAREWVKEESEDGDFHRDAFAYPYLNALFRSILSRNPSARARPQYAWGVVQGVHLARNLAIERVSVIELGVAGGIGLMALEQVAESVEEQLRVHIDVHGFDAGTGLPKPRDYRDCPNLYSEGTYAMDIDALKARLRRTNLILGLVKDTIPQFVHSNPAPIAFAAFDLDMYSSTMDALNLLTSDTSLLLPRVHLLFDDILGFTFGDFNGERLAISDFNAMHQMRKISRLYGLRHYVPSEHANDSWVEKSYMAHIFDHPSYAVRDGLVRSASLDLVSNLNYRIR